MGMGICVKPLFLLCLAVGYGHAFIGSGTMSTRIGFSLTPTSSQPRHAVSLALDAHQTNSTSLALSEDYLLDKANFLQAMNEQLPELQMLQDSSAVSLLPRENNNEMVSKEEARGISDLWKARLLLIGAAALYGTNFSLVKLLGDTMPVGVSSTLRFGFAALVTIPWLIGDTKKTGALTAAGLGFEVGLLNSIGYVSQAVGLETTPACESAFICSLAVVIVPMLDFAAGKQLLSRQWIGAILAVLGVAFLELGGGMSAASITTGDLLSLVQPFAFGIGFWKMEHAMKRFPDQASRMTAAQLLAVFFASTTYGLWETDLQTLQTFPWDEWSTDGSLLFSIFWTGLITTALTIYMETKAMETLSAAETTLIFSTEPLWGTAFAAGIMGEQLGPNVGVGAMFILTACIYSNLGWEGLQSSIRAIPVKDIWRQWTKLSTSTATSWASLKVADNTPKLEEAAGTVEEKAAIAIEELLKSTKVDLK